MSVYIDVGDGTVIAAPVATPYVAPTPPPVYTQPTAPPPPTDTTTSYQAQPIPQAGQPLVETTPGIFVPLPPLAPTEQFAVPIDTTTTVSTQGEQIAQPGHVYIPLDDGTTILAPISQDYIDAHNQQPTSGVPEDELPGLGDRDLASYTGLTGMAWVQFVKNGCANRRLDDLAVFANAMAEGIHGGIGDHGTSYGPWQLHKNGALPKKYWSLPDNNDKINNWAWSTSGADYALDAMAKTSAVGKRGHAAVNALVAEFERPSNIPYEQGLRIQIYDQLAAMSDPYAFLAKQANGSQGGSTSSPTVAPSPKKGAVGAVARWRDLIDVFGKDIPATHARIKAASDNLIGVFK